jgi:hypothetical protein
MGAQGRHRLSCVGRGASVSLTAGRPKQLSGIDAARIEGHHLWRDFLGAVSDPFSMGRFALPTHDFVPELASDGCPATRCGCTKDRLYNRERSFKRHPAVPGQKRTSGYWSH